MVARSVSLLAAFALSANANYFYTPNSPPEPPAPEPYVPSPYAGVPAANVTTSSDLPVHTPTKDCAKVRSDCQSQPDAVQAHCAALFAQCAGTTSGLNEPAPSTTLRPTSSLSIDGENTHTIYYTATSTFAPEKTPAGYVPVPVSPTPAPPATPVPSAAPPKIPDCHAQYKSCRLGQTHLSTCVAELVSCKKHALGIWLGGKDNAPPAPSQQPPTTASYDCQGRYDACRGTGSPNLSTCVAEFEACKSGEVNSYPALVPVQTSLSSASQIRSLAAVPTLPVHTPVPSGTSGPSDCQAQYDACRGTGSPNLSSCVAEYEACKSGEVKSYPAAVPPKYTSKNVTQPAVKPTKAPVPSGTSGKPVCQAKYDACRGTGSPNLSTCVAEFEACKSGEVKSYPAADPVAPVHTPVPNGPSDCQAKYDACCGTGNPNLSACVVQFEACKNGGDKTYPGVVPLYPSKNATRPAYKPTNAPVPTGTSGTPDCQAKYDACRGTGSPNLSTCVAQFEACQEDHKQYYPVHPPVVKTGDVTVYTTVCPETTYATYGSKVITSVYKVTKTLTITSCPGGPCEPTHVPEKSYPVGAPPVQTYPVEAPPSPPVKTYPVDAPPAPPANTYPPQAPPGPPVIKTHDVTVYTTVCPETTYATYGSKVITSVYKVTKTLTITSCPGGPCEPTHVPEKSYPVGAPPVQTYPVGAPPAPPANTYPPQAPPAPPAPPAEVPPVKTYPPQAPPAPPAPPAEVPPVKTYPPQAPPAPPAPPAEVPPVKTYPPQAPPAPPAPPAEVPPVKTYPVEAPPAKTYPPQAPPAPPAPPAEVPPVKTHPPQAPPAPPAPPAEVPPVKTYPVEAPPAKTYPPQAPPAPPAPPAEVPPVKTYPVEAPPAKTYPPQAPPAPPAPPAEVPPVKTYPPQAPPAPPAPPAEVPPVKTYPPQGPPTPPSVSSSTLVTTPVGTAPGAPTPTNTQYTFTGAASTLKVGSVGLLSLFAFIFLL